MVQAGAGKTRHCSLWVRQVFSNGDGYSKATFTVRAHDANVRLHRILQAKGACPAPVFALELGGRYSRVVTLEDKVIIYNACPDRDFVP